MIEKRKLVKITHSLKSGGLAFVEIRDAEVAVIVGEHGKEDVVIWMNLSVKRKIDQQEATYHYLVNKIDGTAKPKRWMETDLSEGCLYEFEAKWNRCWDPILPTSHQVDSIKLEVLAYE